MSALSRVCLLLALCAVIYHKTVTCHPVDDTDESDETSTEKLNDTDVVPQDLYVIKTVIYEVGILTDAANATDNSTETHEQVDVSFFDPASNGSVIDLSEIPVPIQTNVSGLTVAGLVPAANLASILLPPAPGADAVPALPTRQIVVLQNFSTSDPEKGAQIVDNLPKLLGLTKTKTTSSESPKEATTGRDELVFELE